jgi:hypothetical protein
VVKNVSPGISSSTCWNICGTPLLKTITQLLQCIHDKNNTIVEWATDLRLYELHITPQHKYNGPRCKHRKQKFAYIS